LFFVVVSTRRIYFLKYFAVATTGGASAANVIVNTPSIGGVAHGQDPHREHPRFVCELPGCDNVGVRALRQLHEDTLAAVGSTSCPPKPFAN
jgi:hypothetical protein